MPLVSVLMPVHNAAETLTTAVKSILHQTLEDFELIIVDDGSSDATPQLLKSFSDRRIRCFFLPHMGVAAAANFALRHASAGYIARMDADDWSHPHRLQRQLELLPRENVDVIGCCVSILDRSQRPVASMQRYQNWINHDTIRPEQIRALRFVELPLVNPTILAKRAYFELLFRQHEFPEDYDLMLRAAHAGMTFAKCPEVLFHWFDSDGRLTRNDHRYSRDAFMNCRRFHLLRGPLCSVTTVDLWGVGKEGKTWLRWLQACGLTVRRAYDVNARKIGTLIHQTPVCGPDDIVQPDGTPLVIAVGAQNARTLIDSFIRQKGYQPGKDAWFVA